MSEQLPQLVDCKAIMEETGCKRAFAESLMRACPKITGGDVRKVYCRRIDIFEELERRLREAA